MNDQPDISAFEMIARQFEFDSFIESAITLAQIKKVLEEKIRKLIQQEPEKLFWILYRLDISEEKTMLAFNQPEAPSLLADLIIKRQIEKAESRKKFRQAKPGNDHKE